MKSSPQDALRSARLVLDAELAAGRIDQSVLHQRLTTHRSAWTRSPSRLTRVAQRLKMNTRRFDGVDALMGAALSFRGKVLDGGGASGPPRFLVRADEFPVASESAISDSSIVRHFHGIMTSKNVPYLMALVPSPAKSYLDPQATGERNLNADELRLLQQMAADGVCFAQHGTTHRTRFVDPRRRSELSGLHDADLLSVLQAGRARLIGLGVASHGPGPTVQPLRSDAVAHAGIAIPSSNWRSRVSSAGGTPT